MTDDSGWDVVVLGGANTDYLVRGERLPGPGDTAEGAEFHQGPGGKGANQAVAAARLGARVTFLARLGRDERGNSLLQQLQSERVDTRWVVRDAEIATGVALIMVDQHGQKQIQTAPGANRKFSSADVQNASQALQNTKVLLSQLEVPLEALTAAFQIAKQAGATTVLDPAPPVPLDDELLRLVDVIRPNSGEAEVLTGMKVHDRTSARRAAEALLKRGVGAVVVQAGEDGNLLVTKDGDHLFSKVKVTSVDATGAGDAFAASLAVLLAEAKNLVEAAKFANAAAALATTVVGAQGGLPTRAAVLQLLEQQKS